MAESNWEQWELRGSASVHINTCTAVKWSCFCCFLSVYVGQFQSHVVPRWQSEPPLHCCPQQTERHSQPSISLSSALLKLVVYNILPFLLPNLEEPITLIWAPFHCQPLHWMPCGGCRQPCVSFNTHEATSSQLRARSFPRKHQKQKITLLTNLNYEPVLFFVERALAKKVILVQYL